MSVPGWCELTGQQHDLLLPVVEGGALLLHGAVLPHWHVLATRAQAAGFQLCIASAWRGFERQRQIWNGKAAGQRVVLDGNGQALDVATLDEEALLFAMLRWSAVPGCSRHHWGTDIDVYDAAAVPQGYSLQLTTDECVGCGPFAALHHWLDDELSASDAVFFRPYAEDRGGIAPEPWHLSCRPVAARYDALLQPAPLLAWILQQDIALKAVIARHWDDIFHRYVKIGGDTDHTKPGIDHVDNRIA